MIDKVTIIPGKSSYTPKSLTEHVKLNFNY